MKHTQAWQSLFGISALAMINLPTVAMATPTLSGGNQSLVQNSENYQIAQAGSDCRKVDARYGLNIRERPTENSRIVGVVANGAKINIESRGQNGWVPIDDPRDGYVSAEYLNYCGTPTPPQVSCAQVDAYGGLNVRRRPTTNSPIIRTLDNGRYVNIREARGSDWVSISAPVSGFVASGYLESCS